MKMLKKAREILEELGCWVSSCQNSPNDNEVCTEVGFYSDGGEDFFVCVWSDGTDEDFANKFWEVYENFDPEEHAAMWYENRERVKGVPQSLRFLLNDADAIEEKLHEIAGELHDRITRKEKRKQW